jgi:hypothetical protein
VQLTEAFMMDPEAIVSVFVFHHRIAPLFAWAKPKAPPGIFTRNEANGAVQPRGTFEERLGNSY